MNEKQMTDDINVNQLLAGKKGLVMGVANERSIAYPIAKLAYEQGAELAFTYQSEPLKSRVEPIANDMNSKIVAECDVTNEQSLDELFATIKQEWGKLDFIIHSIAFADKNELRGRYIDTSLQNFLNSMHISCYSFVSIARRAAELMSEGGDIITLTYYGAEKVIPNYNVMGVAKAALEASIKYAAADLGLNNIKVNGISAGPIKTLAASGIGNFNAMLRWQEQNTPLRRNVTQTDVAKTALYLLSDLSSGVTGEVIHVDSGYHVMGMCMPEDK